MSQQEQKAPIGSGGFRVREGAPVEWEFGTSCSEPAANTGESNWSFLAPWGGTHGRLQPLVIFKEPSSQKLQKMKATKAKRDSAKTTSTKDYIVQGAKEDTGSMDVETSKTDNTESRRPVHAKVISEHFLDNLRNQPKRRRVMGTERGLRVARRLILQRLHR